MIDWAAKTSSSASRLASATSDVNTVSRGRRMGGTFEHVVLRGDKSHENVHDSQGEIVPTCDACESDSVCDSGEQRERLHYTARSESVCPLFCPQTLVWPVPADGARNPQGNGPGRGGGRGRAVLNEGIKAVRCARGSWTDGAGSRGGATRST